MIVEQLPSRSDHPQRRTDYVDSLLSIAVNFLLHMQFCIDKNDYLLHSIGALCKKKSMRQRLVDRSKEVLRHQRSKQKISR